MKMWLKIAVATALLQLARVAFISCLDGLAFLMKLFVSPDANASRPWWLVRWVIVQGALLYTVDCTHAIHLNSAIKLHVVSYAYYHLHVVDDDAKYDKVRVIGQGLQEDLSLCRILEVSFMLHAITSFVRRGKRPAKCSGDGENHLTTDNFPYFQLLIGCALLASLHLVTVGSHKEIDVYDPEEGILPLGAGLLGFFLIWAMQLETILFALFESGTSKGERSDYQRIRFDTLKAFFTSKMANAKRARRCADVPWLLVRLVATQYVLLVLLSARKDLHLEKACDLMLYIDYYMFSHDDVDDYEALEITRRLQGELTTMSLFNALFMGAAIVFSVRRDRTVEHSRGEESNGPNMSSQLMAGSVLLASLYLIEQHGVELSWNNIWLLCCIQNIFLPLGAILVSFFLTWAIQVETVLCVLFERTEAHHQEVGSSENPFSRIRTHKKAGHGAKRRRATKHKDREDRRNPQHPASLNVASKRESPGAKRKRGANVKHKARECRVHAERNRTTAAEYLFAGIKKLIQCICLKCRNWIFQRLLSCRDWIFQGLLSVLTLYLSCIFGIFWPMVVVIELYEEKDKNVAIINEEQEENEAVICVDELTAGENVAEEVIETVPIIVDDIENNELLDLLPVKNADGIQDAETAKEEAILCEDELAADGEIAQEAIKIQPGEANGTKSKENGELLTFLETNCACLKGSPSELCQWMRGSQDIFTLSDLAEAVQDDAFLNVTLKSGDGNVGVKGFKRTAFKAAVLSATSTERDPVDKMKIPNELYCPISHELMVHDPVVSADGYTYERSAITDWFRRQQEQVERAKIALKANPDDRKAKSIIEQGILSPVSHNRLDNLILIPNRNVLSQARDVVGAKK